MAKSSEEKYKAYREAYLKRQNQLIDKGYTMNTKMYNYREFQEQYWKTKDAIREEVKMGLRKKASGNIYLTMVSDQATEIGRREYESLKEVYKTTGVKMNFDKYSTWKEVRDKMPIEVSEFLKEEYQSLNKIYKDSVVTKGIIAQLYFGS